MDVTRQNFEEVLPLIETAIDNADLLAIDGEFTGLSCLDGAHSDNCYDTLEERYGKIANGSADFLLIQFGLAVFRYNSETSKYESNTFNFYLFPVPFSRQAPDPKFLCQASSIDFLVSQGFDFNKTFRDGIPYLSFQDEMKMRVKLQQRHEMLKARSPAFTSPAGTTCDLPVKSPAVVPEEQKGFLRATMNGIQHFLSTSEPTLDLPPCTAFQRKLIYQTAQIEFRSKIFLETITLGNRERYIRISRVTSDADIANKEIQRQVAEVNELDKAVGFSKVIKLMSKSGKLIVGHNMCLDLIHVVHQFHAPLPRNYDQFKSALNCLFPLVCDTKLMSNMHPFREQFSTTSLSDLHQYLEAKPFKKITLHDSDNAYVKGDIKLHEAGYDAYITGLCFIRMANYLGTFHSPPLSHVPPSSPLLRPFINKIFVMRIADIPYLDIVGNDLNPSRDNVFHVKINDGKLWNYADVKNFFSSTGVASVGWLGDSSFYVGIPQDNLTLMDVQKLNSSGQCMVTPYHIHKSGDRLVRKRSHEAMQQCAEPTTVTLNVNAEPFVSRGNSPVPDHPENEDVGVCLKRPRMDQNETKAETAGSNKSYASVAKSTTKEENEMFHVPDEW